VAILASQVAQFKPQHAISFSIFIYILRVNIIISEKIPVCK
jgi:hypothetical protein